MGPVLSPARARSPFQPVDTSARGPFQPVDTSAQRLSWDSPWLPPVQCSQTLPLLPRRSLPALLPAPSSRRLLPRSPSPVLPPTQPR